MLLKELLSFSACLALAWHMPIPIACYLEAKPKLLNIFHVFADDVHVHDAWLKTGSVLTFFNHGISAREASGGAVKL